MNHILHANYGGQNTKKIFSSSSNPQKIIHNWSNYDNIAFYEEAASGLLEQLASNSGFNSCCDIEAIKDYIFSKKSLLEVGAGYGRVLSYFIKNQFKGELFAIERSINFYNILQAKFRNKVKIFHTDLHDFYISRKFDVILWMWSGIADFSKREQPAMLDRLAFFLKKDGLLIIDTAPALRKPIKATQINNQEYRVKLGKKINYVYCPSTKEINNYAKNSGLFVMKNLEYQTPIKRARFLYILQKNSHDSLREIRIHPLAKEVVEGKSLFSNLP